MSAFGRKADMDGPFLPTEQVMDLTTHYMGLQLKSPIVASASPLSADLGNIRHLEDSGAAAIVLPSIFEEQIEADRLQQTLAAVGVENSPAAEGRLSEANQRKPQQYLDLIRRAVEAVDIPIIGSLNGTTEEGWINYAKMIEEAGVTSLELNVYFIPTDISLTGRDVEQRHLEILRAVRKAVDIPIAIKLGPHFSSMGQVAIEFANAGADALVLFNRFYQPDIDLTKLQLLNDLQLSKAIEIGPPLLWIAVLSGRIDASLAASTGVENSEQVLKYLLAGADVVMTTSALLRNGPRYVKELLAGTRGLLSQRNFRNPDSFGRAN